MNDNEINVEEFVLEIRQRQSQFLEQLRRSGRLHQYLLELNEEMNAKYPEMIVKTYTKEEIDDGGMGNV